MAEAGVGDIIFARVEKTCRSQIACWRGKGNFAKSGHFTIKHCKKTGFLKKQRETPRFDFGGHGMLFEDFSGRTWLALHSPNTEFLERLPLIEFEKL